MTIRQAIFTAADALEKAGVPDPRIDAERIVEHITGLERMTMLLSSAKEFTMEQEQRFSSLLLSRTQRKPLQYLLGTQYFYGLPFQVDGRVLIPRQETEELCQLGLKHLSSLEAPVTVLDLCTGSGAIAVTIKHESPAASVTACDLSLDALTLAQINARQNQADVHFLQGDLLSPVKGMRFDLILSNPPYIPTRECASLQPEVMQEPRMALDGGTDGLDFYRRIAQEAPAHLTERGMLAVEAGDGEAEAIAALFRAAGFAHIAIHNDLYGMARMVSGLAKE